MYGFSCTTLVLLLSHGGGGFACVSIYSTCAMLRDQHEDSSLCTETLTLRKSNQNSSAAHNLISKQRGPRQPVKIVSGRP